MRLALALLSAVGLLLCGCGTVSGPFVFVPKAEVEITPVLDLVPLEEYSDLYIVDLELPENAGAPEDTCRLFSQWLAMSTEGLFTNVRQVRAGKIIEGDGAIVLTGRITELKVPPFPAKIGDKSLLRINIRFTDWKTKAVLGEFKLKIRGYVTDFPHSFRQEIKEAAKKVAAYLKDFREEF